MTEHITDSPQFYLSHPSECPYLEGREERKIFTYLVGDQASALNHLLSSSGFRRSQNIAYRPACEGCKACVSVRVCVDDFKPTRSMRRVLKAYRALLGEQKEPAATSEQYGLFQTYLQARHDDGGMVEMSMLDYASMVEETFVDTMVLEYRERAPDSGLTGRGQDPLIAATLTDQVLDGLSMVYSFYAPERAAKGLGTFLILDHIERTRKLGLPYLYLGYWVAGSSKMDYKSRFLPQEHLTEHGWTRYGPQT